MSEWTEPCHLPPIHSLPLRKRLVHGELIKKGPLKKAYTTDHHQRKRMSQGNPLLCTNPSQTCSTEETIDSFKSAWLHQHQTTKPLKKCIPVASQPPLQQKKRLSIGNKSSRKRSTDGKLYCHCRQPYDTTRFMIACDRCDEWFHGECIHINEKEGELIDLYFCTQCSQETGKKTRWKPKCANPACHKAARIGASLGHVSKYCSDSCGLQVARARFEWAEMKRRRCTTSSESVVELCLKKQRQLRIHSLADAQDRARLPEIRDAKKKVRETVQVLDEQLEKLRQYQEKGWCGFDLNQGHVCKQKVCEKHQDWQQRLSKEWIQDKKEQFRILSALEKEWHQVKERMRRRRSEKDIVQDLVNETLCV